MNLRTRLATVAMATTSLLVAAAGSAAACPNRTSDIHPVRHVDVARYVGTWYQIADIPQTYETLCALDVGANYSLNRDGTVAVHNYCTRVGGVPSSVDGTARILDPGRNANLQVSFVVAQGQPVFPDAKPNYVIIGLAKDYSWAVIGDQDRSHGYVLSRTKTLTPWATRRAQNILRHNGYRNCQLTVTQQTGGAAAAAPFC